MKVKVEVECTPVEARAFMGLPDVTPLNDALVAEMQNRMAENIRMLGPDQVLKFWTAFGGQAQEQFRTLMTAATTGAGFGTSAGGGSSTER